MTAVHVCMRVNNAFTHDERVRREAATLAEAGYDVTVVADLKPGTPAEETLGPIRVVRIAKTSAVPYRSIVTPLRRQQADIYHAHDIDSLFPCLAAARLDRRGAKVVYDSHELWSGHARDKVHAKRGLLVRFEGAMLRRADALITASPAYTARMVERYRFRGPSETVLNVPRFWSDEELAGSWRDRDAAREFRIAAVSVFQRGRGAVQLIRALAHLPEDCVVELVGPTPQADYERAMRAAAEPFGDRVRFVGRIPAEQVVPRLAAAHVSSVLIEPLSLSYRLTSPNKLYDSMMAGTPVVASDMGVIGEVTRGEGTGEVCDPADPRDIADAVLRVRERLGEMRLRARDAARRYNWEAEQGKLVRLYETVSEGMRGR